MKLILIALVAVVVGMMAGCSNSADLPLDEIVSLMRSGEKHSTVTKGSDGKLTRRYDLALIDFTKVIEAMPNHTEALKYRAKTYEALGKRELATKDWDRLIDLKPVFTLRLHYISRGENYYAQGHNERALKDFTKAIELNRDYLYEGDPYFRRSLVYETLQQPDKSDADAAEACRLGVNQNIRREAPWLEEKVGFKCAK